ncbi:MAG: hypothetical protein AAB550_00035 [Patescibacteria group bacterium]
MIDLETPIKSSQFNLLTTYDIPTMILTAINLILITASVASFIFLLVGALQWIMSGGDKEGLDKAKKRITSALVGLAITFSVYALTAIVSYLFFNGQNNLFNFTIPTIPIK